MRKIRIFFQKQPPDIPTWKDKEIFLEATFLDAWTPKQFCVDSQFAIQRFCTTLSDLVGDEHDGSDKGFNQFVMRTPEDGLLPLAYDIDMNDRQQCNLLEVDHKDFLLVREQDG